MAKIRKPRPNSSKLQNLRPKMTSNKSNKLKINERLKSAPKSTITNKLPFMTNWLLAFRKTPTCCSYNLLFTRKKPS